MKQYYVYILTNKRHTVLYVGVTNDLKRRVFEHRSRLVKGFTKRYNVESLVYYETCEEVLSAIGREKQIKGGSREDKVRLINSLNPDWKDLYTEI
jgi:putative endonuclease